MFSLLLPLAIIALLVADSPKWQGQKESMVLSHFFHRRVYNPKEDDKPISLVETSHTEQMCENTLQIRWVDWLILNTLLQSYYIVLLRSFYIDNTFYLSKQRATLPALRAHRSTQGLLATQQIFKENRLRWHYKCIHGLYPAFLQEEAPPWWWWNHVAHNRLFSAVAQKLANIVMGKPHFRRRSQNFPYIPLRNNPYFNAILKLHEEHFLMNHYSEN